MVIDAIAGLGTDFATEREGAAGDVSWALGDAQISIQGKIKE